MKKTLFLPIVIVLFNAIASCKKDKAADNSPKHSNELKIQNDGQEYIIRGETFKGNIPSDRYVILSTVMKATDGATFELSTKMNLKVRDFDLSFETQKGSANGVGTFQIKTNGIYAEYVENFSGGEKYSVTGGSVIISKCETKELRLTFSIVVTNANRTKTITGSFYCTDPSIA